ncbi:MAG: hypothetical protein R2690_12695 [Acidimicrobiales bacterium]
MERIVIRRFANASRLTLTIATIGLAQVLGGMALIVPIALDGPPLVGSFERRSTPCRSRSTRW